MKFIEFWAELKKLGVTGIKEPENKFFFAECYIPKVGKILIADEPLSEGGFDIELCEHKIENEPRLSLSEALVRIKTLKMED
jgi:hypothetical protein